MTSAITIKENLNKKTSLLNVENLKIECSKAYFQKTKSSKTFFYLNFFPS